MAKANKKILIVEDDKDFLEILPEVSKKYWILPKK